MNDNGFFLIQLDAHETKDDFEVAVFLTEISSRHAILHKEKRAKTEKPRLGTTEPKLTGEGTRDVPVELVDATELVLLREGSQEEEPPDMANIPTANEEETQPLTPQEDELFVSDSSSQAFENHQALQTSKARRRPKDAITDSDADADDKKKLALRTSYDGFSIYGRILCLVVKRRGNAKGKDLAGGAGQAMMEEWIASTQMEAGQMMDE